MIYRRDDKLTHKNVSVGIHTRGNAKITFIDRDDATVTIGDFCSIGMNVEISIYPEHFTKNISTFHFLEDGTNQVEHKGAINIGNDVWIGNNVVILAGVTIGHGAIIGAYSIVAKDVAPYTIVAGNPAREIRKRFSEDIIEKLLKMAWWKWPEKVIEDRINELMAPPEKWIELYAI